MAMLPNKGEKNMEFLNNTKVGKKLAILIAVAFIALAAMAVLGYYELEKANESLNAMYAERLVPVALLNESRSHIRGINAAVLDLMLTTDAAKNQANKAYIADRVDKNNKNLAAIEKLPLDAKAKEMLSTTDWIKVKMFWLNWLSFPVNCIIPNVSP